MAWGVLCQSTCKRCSIALFSDYFAKQMSFSRLYRGRWDFYCANLRNVLMFWYFFILMLDFLLRCAAETHWCRLVITFFRCVVDLCGQAALLHNLCFSYLICFLLSNKKQRTNFKEVFSFWCFAFLHFKWHWQLVLKKIKSWNDQGSRWIKAAPISTFYNVNIK